jgi:hypothetical protein
LGNIAPVFDHLFSHGPERKSWELLHAGGPPEIEQRSPGRTILTVAILE